MLGTTMPRMWWESGLFGAVGLPAPAWFGWGAGAGEGSVGEGDLTHRRCSDLLIVEAARLVGGG
jgi:hypothetical protein